MVSRTLSVKIVGDTKSGEAAVLQFAASLEKTQKTADVSASKIADDLRKMEAAAKDAAAANEKLANVGSSGAGGGALADLLRMSGSGTVSNAGFSKIADSLDTTAGKAALAGVAVAAAGAVAVKFGSDAVTAFTNAAEEVDKFQDVAGGTAQQASLFVNAAKLLGVSTDSLDTSIGRMLKNVNANEAALNGYGAAVKRTADGSVDTIGTFESIAKAFANTADPAKRAELATLAFGRGWQSINDILEKGGTSLDEIFQKAAKGPILSDADVQKGKDLNVQISEMKLRFGEMEVKAGEVIAPIAEKWIGFATTMVGVYEHAFQGIIDGLQGVAAAGEHLPVVGGKFKEFHDALAGIDVVGDGAADGVNKVGNAANDAAPPVDVLTASIGHLTTAAASISSVVSEIQGLGSGLSSSVTNMAGWANSVDSANQLLTQGAGDAQKYADAQAQGARQIADAQKGVASALQGVADAQAGYAKAVDDANRNIAQSEADYAKAVDDANRKVADAEEQASKQIVSAQQRVTDARRQAAEAAESSARRVEDATQALRDAETDSLREANPYDAQRKREDAGLALTRAQEDAAQQQQDSASSVAQAEQDLAQTQQDAAKSRADAERQAADEISQAQQRIVDAHRQAAEQIQAANKQVEDANGRVAEANDRVSQTSADVAKALDTASASAQGHAVSLQQAETSAQGVVNASPGFVLSMMARGDSIGDINAKLADGKTAIENLGVAFGIPKPVIDDMIAELDKVIDRVLTIRRLTQDAYDWWAALTRAAPAGVTAEQMVADAGWSSGQLKPTHDSGGWLPMGVSLAVNKTGRPERVLSPSEMDHMGNGGGGGTTVIVQGSVISDRDLADIIAKAQRRGYKGF